MCQERPLYRELDCVPGGGLCAGRGAVCWEPDCVPGVGPCAERGAVCWELDCVPGAGLCAGRGAVCREWGCVPGVRRVPGGGPCTRWASHGGCLDQLSRNLVLVVIPVLIRNCLETVVSFSRRKEES